MSDSESINEAEFLSACGDAPGSRLEYHAIWNEEDSEDSDDGFDAIESLVALEENAWELENENAETVIDEAEFLRDRNDALLTQFGDYAIWNQEDSDHGFTATESLLTALEGNPWDSESEDIDDNVSGAAWKRGSAPWTHTYEDGDAPQRMPGSFPVEVDNTSDASIQRREARRRARRQAAEARHRDGEFAALRSAWKDKGRAGRAEEVRQRHEELAARRPTWTDKGRAEGPAEAAISRFTEEDPALNPPRFCYAEFEQYDVLQKEFKIEAGWNTLELQWKTAFLDLATEQELLEEYLGWVDDTKLRQKKEGAITAEGEIFLQGLAGALMVERQDVLHDQALNRWSHVKDKDDERELWERIIKLRKENTGKTVLQEYEGHQKRAALERAARMTDTESKGIADPDFAKDHKRAIMPSNKITAAERSGDQNFEKLQVESKLLRERLASTSLKVDHFSKENMHLRRRLEENGIKAGGSR